LYPALTSKKESLIIAEMKVTMECLGCSLNQTLNECRMCGASEEQTELAMDRMMKVIQDYREFRNPPLIAEKIHEIAYEITGVQDPFLPAKKKDMDTAWKLRPAVEKAIRHSSDPLLMALKASAIGNTLDSALVANPDLENTIAAELDQHFFTPAYESFREDLDKAGSFLLIGDNAGESVFDAVLLSMLPKGIKKYYAARSIPVINDVTLSEALDSGIEDFAQIIESGSHAPGTPVFKCTDEFQKLFSEADIVFSKGQGNYETLDEENRRIYFLFKSKCSVIAAKSGSPIGTYVLTMSDPRFPL
jgi:uncharacterized protein with ATP-grasp and redox domains